MPFLTDDPYEISFDPTDGTTTYVDLLGWAIPEARAGQSCGHRPLAEAVAGVNLTVRVGRNTSDLRVLGESATDCPSGSVGAPAPES